MTAAASTRRAEILELLNDGDTRTPLLERVCEISTRVVGVSSAAMCLVGGRRHRIIVHGTDTLVEGLEDLQVSLGQGPCIEAVRTGSPVLVPELVGHRPPNWPAYADRALARGIRGLFAFPLVAGSAQIGALDLYRLLAGPLDEDQIADALVLAEIAGRSVLARQDGTDSERGVSALRRLTPDR